VTFKGGDGALDLRSELWFPLLHLCQEARSAGCCICRIALGKDGRKVNIQPFAELLAGLSGSEADAVPMAG